ncbi:hypothetical protein A3G50_00685 [Candidatus Jorgensenbacteria bacterium RIFCSPLOWO2_12_FULL_42_11]|uniref:Uncharacterized protein n=1 Tax=Candidatus Jorgensenbacteria bacterium RIFCSPLOWO2_12_FULL_42_11 TaxID=1798473 RepID=A0A1F6C148_9BACT|nr:MAG: hypothetical protein A3G50_00685 [Candidatus Jorgensenbacteria bacterium RIFCSPLOWO2_12_FULL_42_11]
MGQPTKEPKSKLLKSAIVNPNISLNLFRKYGRAVNGRFEIQVELPQYLRVINRHQDFETALTDYEEMVEAVGKGTPEEISEFKGKFFV